MFSSIHLIIDSWLGQCYVNHIDWGTEILLKIRMVVGAVLHHHTPHNFCLKVKVFLMEQTHISLFSLPVPCNDRTHDPGKGTEKYGRSSEISQPSRYRPKGFRWFWPRSSYWPLYCVVSSDKAARHKTNCSSEARNTHLDRALINKHLNNFFFKLPLDRLRVTRS